MKKNKIFVACDTTNINKINEIITKTKSSNLIQVLCVEKTLFSPKSRFNLGWFLPEIIKHKNVIAIFEVPKFLIT